MKLEGPSSEPAKLPIDPTPIGYHRSPSPIPLQLLEPPENGLGLKGEYQQKVLVPWRKMVPIMYFCVADAFTYAVIFPFITDMITSFNVPQDKIGLYSGMAEGTMMVVEAAVATTWAKLGDKYGRKRCILCGFSITLVAAPMLGFSTAVWQIIFWRALLGLNPSGVLTKTVAAEISHPTNRAYIFSLLSPSFGVGFLLGTFLGGELAHPFGRLPNWLGGSVQLWKRSPYALPCVVVLCFDAIAIVVGYLFLPETLRPRSEKESEEHESAKKGAIWATCRVPNFILATAVSCLFQISYFSLEGMFAVWCYTKTEQGGLGVSVDLIGILYSVGSTFSIFAQPLFLARFREALGEIPALLIVLAAWPLVGLLIPVASFMAIHARGAMWASMGIFLSLKTFGNFGWAMTDVMIMSAFDDYPHLLATGSAVSLIAGAGGRAIGPAISGWMFSISTEFPTASLGRQLSWIYFVTMTTPAVFMVYFMPRESRSKEGYEAVPLVENGMASGMMEHVEENEPVHRY